MKAGRISGNPIQYYGIIDFKQTECVFVDHWLYNSSGDEVFMKIFKPHEGQRELA